MIPKIDKYYCKLPQQGLGAEPGPAANNFGAFYTEKVGAGAV